MKRGRSPLLALVVYLMYLSKLTGHWGRLLSSTFAGSPE